MNCPIDLFLFRYANRSLVESPNSWIDLKWASMKILAGWWLSLPSEKWWTSSVGMMTIPNWMKSHKSHVPKHQPAMLLPNKSKSVTVKSILAHRLSSWPQRFICPMIQVFLEALVLLPLLLFIYSYISWFVSTSSQSHSSVWCSHLCRLKIHISSKNMPHK